MLPTFARRYAVPARVSTCKTSPRKRRVASGNDMPITTVAGSSVATATATSSRMRSVQGL
jgi:hypothetical protein